ncbi:MAG: hypothetical protein E7313_00985 [Clostridiales bacterium]|nr:hypothetical protein [Clostridiales bacterium]
MKLLIKFSYIISIIILLCGCSNSSNTENSNNNNNITYSKTQTQIAAPSPKEIEISNFSTPLKSGTANRLVNIKLTCDKINGQILKSGDTFSFNSIVGPCTAEEGYKEAEIYVNNKIKYALGGRKLSSKHNSL